MEITFEKDNSTMTIDYSGDVGGLLKQLGINPQTVLVAANNRIVQIDDMLNPTDAILIISVISGG